MGLAEKRKDYFSFAHRSDLQWEEENNFSRNQEDLDNAHLILMVPQGLEDAQAVLDHLKANQGIVVNLESLPREKARRMMDYLAGGAYGKDGQIQKIAASTYLILPGNVSYLDESRDSWASESYF